MYLTHHGGQCCGIRHIHSIGWSPDEVPWHLPIRKSSEVPAASGFRIPMIPAVSDKTLFDLPYISEENSGQLMTRIIRYCEANRPHGIIEVVTANEWDESGGYSEEMWGLEYECGDPEAPHLTSENCDDGQTMEWRDFLLSLGFCEVNVCRNSNTGNHVTVWHRNSGQVPKLPDPGGVEETLDPFS